LQERTEIEGKRIIPAGRFAERERSKDIGIRESNKRSQT
jgi:hypothetical protein